MSAYRHEYKYPITLGQLNLLRQRIAAIAEPDAHAGENGCYEIRSLYFDDCDNSFLYDNIIGTDNREKFRIRIYNHSDSRISLEIKEKLHNKTHKRSCRISRDQCDFLMQGEVPPDIAPEQRELNRLAVLMYTRRMAPAVIVEYKRIPYVYRTEDANVRVTFDFDITACQDTEDFFQPILFSRPVLPTGKALMEVKFDSFLPDEIYQVLNLGSLQTETFSKYYLCRKFPSML